MPFRSENRHFTLSLMLLVVSLLAFGVGVQAWLAHRDNVGRDRDLAAAERADDAYADCLTDFAVGLVEALRATRNVAVELDEARDRKDDALDTLLELTAQAQASDATTQADLPPELVARYERVLAERIDAQRDFRRLERKAIETRAENPYLSPTAVCER